MPLFSRKKVFVIAEMANSHEGSLAKAKEITEDAANAGADAIKFQKFKADELAEKDHENYALYKRLEMTIKEWRQLIEFAKKKKLKVLVDIFGVESAKELLRFKIDGYKIHSADLSNPHLLKFLGDSNKSILISAAGSTLNEMDDALRVLLKTPKEIAIMHGFQGYPTELHDLNLRRLKKLKERYCFSVGIMDHVSGDSEMALITPLLGISLGATIVEKHITLDRSKKGLDYYSALNPDEFGKMVSLIKMTETALDDGDFSLSPNELTYRLAHKKNPISRLFIGKNTKLNENMFEYKRTKTKQDSLSAHDFKGKMTSKEISKGKILTRDMIKHKPKVAAVIACRVHSSRLFAKQLQLVGGIPILQHVLNQIKKSKEIDEIILAISEKPGNEPFVDFAKSHRLKFIFGDDKDVLKRLIDGARYVNANIVFRITPENPYIYWEGIDDLIKNHIKGKYDFSYLDVVPLGSGFEVINRAALELSHKQGTKKHRSELCSLYIYEHRNKFKIKQFLPFKNLQRSELRVTVDTPEDLTVARKIYESIGKDEKPIPLIKVIRFLDKNPDVVKINSNIPLGVSRIWIPNDPLRRHKKFS